MILWYFFVRSANENAYIQFYEFWNSYINLNLVKFQFEVLHCYTLLFWPMSSRPLTTSQSKMHIISMDGMVGWQHCHRPPPCSICVSNPNMISIIRIYYEHPEDSEQDILIVHDLFESYMLGAMIKLATQ